MSTTIKISPRDSAPKVAANYEVPKELLAQEKLKEDQSFKSVFVWFMNFTSIGGLSQSKADRGPIAKLFWMIMFFLGLAGTFPLILNVVQDYLDKAIITTVTVSSLPTVPFPGVTICHYNKVHCGNLLERIEWCLEPQNDTSSIYNEPCSPDTLLTLCKISEVHLQKFSDKMGILQIL